LALAAGVAEPASLTCYRGKGATAVFTAAFTSLAAVGFASLGSSAGCASPVLGRKKFPLFRKIPPVPDNYLTFLSVILSPLSVAALQRKPHLRIPRKGMQCLSPNFHIHVL
jgi:hypothetical protein